MKHRVGNKLTASKRLGSTILFSHWARLRVKDGTSTTKY